MQRSVRLAPRVVRGSGKQEGELDLVFNWAGKLWVVDCKDRRSAEDRVEQLRTEILSQLTPDRRLVELLPDPLSPLFATLALPLWNDAMRGLAQQFGIHLIGLREDVAAEFLNALQLAAQVHSFLPLYNRRGGFLADAVHLKQPQFGSM